ncbi:MAG: tRNA pseudouridine55 synthase [Glaciecola sp.]|jgi:tRNA pseudouridine55 synthase
MGRRPKSRNPDLDGVLVINKPVGMTSHDVVAVVRRITGQRRAGHTGTLDPDATGVLVICLGRATRLVQFLQAGQKTYAARMVLGLATSSQDAAGKAIFEADASAIDEVMLCEALTAMVGDVLQIPPMVSAIKIDGERLHEKARRGEVVDRDPRPITIHSIVLEDWEAGARAEAAFLVTCSPGTYVRTIAHDVGESLGVGGSLVSLCRTANAQFTLDDAITLDELARAGEDGLAPLLVSMPQAVIGMSRVEVDAAQAWDIAHGRRVPARGIEGAYAILHGGMVLAIQRDVAGFGKSEVVLVQPDDLVAPQPSDSQPNDAPS